ncbi:HAMP domain-containing protein, partial [Rhizobium oryzicola]
MLRRKVIETGGLKMFSIRNVLITIFGVISIALSGFVCRELYDSYQRYSNQTAVVKYSTINKALFEFLVNYRLERGRTNTAFLAPSDKMGGFSDIATYRKAVDDAYKTITAFSFDDMPANLQVPLKKLVPDYQGLVAMRGQVDTEFSKAVDVRDKQLKARQMSQGQAVLDNLEIASGVTEAKIRELDSTLSDILVVREAAWAARAASGNESNYIAGAVISGQALEKKDVFDLIANRIRGNEAWQRVRNYITSASVPDELRKVRDVAERDYFGGTAWSFRDDLYKALTSGGTSKTTLDEWNAINIKGQATIAEVALTAVKAARDRAAENASDALEYVMIYAAILVTTLVVGIAGMAIIIRRVIRPIAGLTASMTHLADGDTQSLIPFTSRQDEIGGMAGSVEVFRQAAIRNKQLEAEAEENRKRAEAGRIEVQRLAEAEAQERLERATGSLAAGLKRLASGDMLCEIHEQ